MVAWSVSTRCGSCWRTHKALSFSRAPGFQVSLGTRSGFCGLWCCGCVCCDSLCPLISEHMSRWTIASPSQVRGVFQITIHIGLLGSPRGCCLLRTCDGNVSSVVLLCVVWHVLLLTDAVTMWDRDVPSRLETLPCISI